MLKKINTEIYSFMCMRVSVCAQVCTCACVSVYPGPKHQYVIISVSFRT